MLTLLRADLFADLRVWIGTFAVLVSAGAAVGIPATLVESAVHERDLYVQLGLLSVASIALTISVVSLVIVLSSTVRTLVELRRRTFALWLIVGMQPSQVSLVVLGELSAVAVVGSAIGSVIAWAVAPALVGTLLEGSSGLGDVTATLGAGSAAIGAAVVVAVVVIAAIPRAREAGSTPVLALLQGGRRRTPKVVGRLIACTLLLALAASMFATLPQSFANGASQSVLLGPVLIAAAASAAPLYVPGLIRVWTSVIPSTRSVSWFLARATVIDSAQRSSASVVSFYVAIGLLWTFLVGQNTVASSTGGSAAADPRPLALLLGAPTLLAAVGAAAGVLMASSFREREDALLDVAGAEGSVRTLTAAWEALIYVATAAILAAVTAAVVAFGLTLFLAPLAPTLSPQLAPLLGLVGTAVCLVLAWVATFAPRLSRSGSTVEVLGGS
jgi:putative ABC transport system permease protein